MVNFQEYTNTRNAIDLMIKNKQDMVNELENEIHHLRKTLRIVDTEFKEKIEKKELPPEFH